MATTNVPQHSLPAIDKMAVSTDAPPSFESHFEYFAPVSDPSHSPLTHAQTHTTSSNRSTIAVPRLSLDNASNVSVLPSYTTAKYGIHKSEAEYLAALRSWADSKMYTQADSRGGLTGFYGDETMEERMERLPRLRAGRKASQRAKGSKEEERPIVEPVVQGEEQRMKGRQRSKSSLVQWLKGRKASAAV